MEEEIKAEFTKNGFILDDEEEICKQCLTFCIEYKLSPSDIVSSWDVYSLNRGLEIAVQTAHMGAFLQQLQNEQRDKVIAREAGLHLYSSDVSMLLNEEDEDVKEGILDTPTDKSTRANEEPSDSAQKTNGSLFASEKHLVSVTPFGQRKNKFVVQSTLNEHPNIQSIKEEQDRANSEDDIIKRVQPSKHCSLVINRSHPEPGCRFMYDRIEDKFNFLENRIKNHATAFVLSGLYEEIMDPTIASEKCVFSVGMICCEEEGRLKEKPILLQSSVEHSGGQRVRLDLQKLNQFSIFPGQVVGVEGHNPSGHCLIASKIVDYVPLSVPSNENLPPAKKQAVDKDLQSTNPSQETRELSLIVAAGPFTTTDNLLFEPLAELLAYARRKQPQLIVLLGPFIDSDHPEIKKGSVHLTFDEMFHLQILGKLQDYVEYMGSTVRVILMPSVRDANHDFVFPQPAFDIHPMDFNYQIYSVSNPGTFSGNEVKVACCTVDILKQLSAEEISRNPQGGSKQRMTNLANHILKQRSFYPLYPPAEEVPLDFSLAREALHISSVPDILILPSDLTQFVKTGGSEMPPSPAMRISPRRELRAENHKRGRSLESGILYREKDDDLALFNEVQNKERENFLLQSNDFDDISTKLRGFSDYKLGISIPARGESCDLLNAEEDKNDYDWLITPPDTPLFPSLDDETPPINLARRGRPRSQPLSISRSSTMEKSYRNSRGSASPHRLSPSPQSGDNTLHSRGRPSSAPHASPPPTLRHPTSSRRPSPPPSKPSTPATRSSTPTSRRMSTGSAAPSRVRGTSPVKTSKGYSASPKISAWQSHIPDFSSEAPPNLRTSLADRPASYVRGSSPASGKGSRSGRQSMSPTASRSVSSSHSRDRDPFSSHSKGSVASSGDDDLDSPQSISMSSLDRSTPKSIGAFPNNRALGFSKKPSRILSSSSAPKRSFDLALQQMDRRKGPQNMFRPLLSSVPSSTFCAGKASTAHRSMTSRTSSVTTSNNTSSDQVTNGVHDTEGSEQNQQDVTSECVEGQYSEAQDEIFVLDQSDALNEDVEYISLQKSPCNKDSKFDGHSVVNSQLVVTESCSQLDTATAIATTSVVSETKGDRSDTHSLEEMMVCSQCGLTFHSAELVMEGDLQLCLECKSLEVTSSIPTTPVSMMVVDNTSGDFVQTLKHGPPEALDCSTANSESLQVTNTCKSWTKQLDKIPNEGQRSYSEPSQNFSPESSLSPLLVEEGELIIIDRQVIDQSIDGNSGHLHVGGYSSSKVVVSEGAGVSMLLKRSRGSKGHVQSRSFTTSNISYDDFSCVGDSVNSMRSSIGHGSASMSSSVDLGSLRQIETRVQRQLNDRKSDIENYRFEILTKHKRSLSSLSGASSHGFQVLSVATSSHDDCSARIHLRKQSLTSECTEAESPYTDIESNNNFRTASELSGNVTSIHIADTSVVSVLNFEEPASHEGGDYLKKGSSNSMTIEASSTLPQTCTLWEDATPNSCDGVDVAEVPNRSSLDAISETEIENGDIFSNDSQSDVDSTNSKSGMNGLMQPSVSKAPNDDMITSIEEPDISDPGQSTLVAEESTVMPEDQGRLKARSLTLEDATDTILYCSSIVHNLVYEAANRVIEKENSTMEGSRPTVMLVGKSNTDRRDVRTRTTGKRTSKSQKARQKKPETDTKLPHTNAEKDEKTDVSSARVVGAPNNGDTDSTKPLKLESKCNCTIM
ncbi:putative microtubule-associated protein futsch [Abeliophyllum distichum]|uniref:DNA polymerase alpha subunit B n=1 Tax=Abeliophyllum distichum TaxID=126358 RepID=A0ABD1R8N8_9LAMI